MVIKKRDFQQRGGPHLYKKAAFTEETLNGDFNFDHSMKFSVNYRHRDLSMDLDETLGTLDLIQMVSFKTWTSKVNNICELK